MRNEKWEAKGEGGVCVCVCWGVVPRGMVMLLAAQDMWAMWCDMGGPGGTGRCRSRGGSLWLRVVQMHAVVQWS